jgi:hypothetical protein
MYPSDYGYATSGGDTGRETCLSYKLGSWNGYNDCYGNDFLYLGSNEWTLMPYSSYFDSAFYVNGSGYDGYYNVTGTFAVRPVGYLKSNAKILSGSGTNDEPWIISL